MNTVTNLYTLMAGLDLIAVASGSIAMADKRGERQQLCRVLRDRTNLSEMSLLDYICAVGRL